MLERRIIPVLVVNLLAVLLFTIIFVARGDYEFLLYVGVILLFAALILATYRRVNYPQPVLWGLTLWALLHMAGGGLFVGGKKLYSLMLIPIVGEPYLIFKYDQLVHIVGFGVATLVMYYLLKPSLGPKRWVSLGIVLAMAGLGVGALNEIIEFGATVLVPETGVGGYENTALDLVADLLGAVLAVLYLWRAEHGLKRPTKKGMIYK